MSYIKAQYLVIKYKLVGFDSNVDAHWAEFRKIEDSLLQAVPEQRWRGDDLVYELVSDFETEEDGNDIVFNLTVQLHDRDWLRFALDELREYLRTAYGDRLRVHAVELQSERVVYETEKVEL
jgi:hypothetical protein